MSVTRLEWDSGFFGLAIGRLEAGPGRVRPGEIDEALSAAATSELDCLYLEIPFSPEASALSGRPGFVPVDLKVTLEKRTGPAENAAAGGGPEISDRVSPSDLPALEAIAEEISEWSRFARDPRFGAAEAKRLYREWLRRSLFEGFASDVLVARREQASVGLLTLRERAGRLHIDLFGVAAASRGRGAGMGLLGAAGERAASRGVERLFVATQGDNIGALRSYEKAGFRIEGLSLVYHIWLDRRR